MSTPAGVATAPIPVRREIAETLFPRDGSADALLPPLLILLTVVTGIVDALAYLALGRVFVAADVILAFVAVAAHRGRARR